MKKKPSDREITAISWETQNHKGLTLRYKVTLDAHGQSSTNSADQKEVQCWISQIEIFPAPVRNWKTTQAIITWQTRTLNIQYSINRCHKRNYKAARLNIANCVHCYLQWLCMVPPLKANIARKQYTMAPHLWTEDTTECPQQGNVILQEQPTPQNTALLSTAPIRCGQDIITGYCDSQHSADSIRVLFHK